MPLAEPGRGGAGLVPGHALHEKGLQRQKSVGTLVSSQERRALAVPVINRLSTAGQPLISFLHRFTWDFVCSCFRKVVQDSVFDSLEGKTEGCLLARSTRRRPVLPSPAPPRRPAVRRPDPTGP